ACTPLHLYRATDPAITESVEAITRLCRIGGAIFPTFPERVLRLAAVQLEAGDHQALEWLARLLDVASPTWTWSGGAGDGHDAVVGATFCSFVRDLLVREIPGGLALCTMLPHDWRGQSIEVHHAPTQAGLLSFAVRWHGLRPALLWELRRHRPAESITLTAPGLDPQWQTDKPAGEALLGPLAPPAGCPDAADRLR
ncbi:MAG TPA: hypothetical protein VLL25_02275, partial [Acidimicrobiales bacterium]|nr:hypothetical protein [Acidimicrobiales bacterium]